MVQFLSGFFVAWIMISIFLNFTNNKKCGIDLSEGWATTLIFLPLVIIIFPFFGLYKLYRYISVKISNKYTDLRYKNRRLY